MGFLDLTDTIIGGLQSSDDNHGKVAEPHFKVDSIIQPVLSDTKHRLIKMIKPWSQTAAEIHVFPSSQRTGSFASSVKK